VRNYIIIYIFLLKSVIGLSVTIVNPSLYEVNLCTLLWLSWVKDYHLIII